MNRHDLQPVDGRKGFYGKAVIEIAAMGKAEFVRLPVMG